MACSDDAAYEATVSSSWAPVLDLWSRMSDDGAALAFQQRAWLEAWQNTVGKRTELECLAVTIRNASGPVAALPLVRETRRLRRIGFADGGLADYNAPILTREAPQDKAGAIRLWRALLRVLPAADVIRLERMPRRVGNLVNPFSLLPGARPSPTDGLSLTMPAGFEASSFEAWRSALPRRYRMELGRCARLFDALPGAAFVRVPGGSPTVFQALETLQRDRIAVLGLPYSLDDELAKTFYRRLADSDPAVLTALIVEERVVAALLGLRQGATFTMLRIGAAADLARMSPARNLIVRTMADLEKEGVSTFDFGLGDYDYKRRLGGRPHHLIDLLAARSPFGIVEAADARLRAYIRTKPKLHAAWRRVMKSNADRQT